MLLFFTLLLIFSSVGMALLLYAKHWELTTGRLLFGSARPFVTSAARQALLLFEEQFPRALKRIWFREASKLRRFARDFLARTLIRVEHMLEKTLNALKHGFSPANSADPAVRGEVSAFLREVAEHKRKLARATRVSRARKPKAIKEITPTSQLDTHQGFE